MAEKEPPAPPNAEKKIEADIYSREFDPVVALYSNNFKPPSLTAPTFDNIEAFVRKVEASSEATKPKASKSTDISDRAQEIPLVRQFPTEQLPTFASRKEPKNILRYMQRVSESKGPMNFFSKCMVEGVRIKVLVREAHHIKGYAIGTLVAHDKHWNLALVDVFEQYNRRRFPKSINFSVENVTEDLQAIEFSSESENESSSAPNPRRSERPRKGSVEYYGASKVTVKKIRRKSELCERFVPQAVLRGEHVAIIQILHDKND